MVDFFKTIKLLYSKTKRSFRCECVKLGVLFLTAGSDLAGHRNVGKNKRTKYCEVIKLIVNKFQMQARQGVLFLTAGSDLAGHSNVGKNKRTKYCVVDKAYCK